MEGEGNLEFGGSEELVGGGAADVLYEVTDVGEGGVVGD